MSKRKLPDIETLKRLYLGEKKTLAEICIMFDCSTKSRLHQKDPSIDWELKRKCRVRAMAHYGWSVEEFIERFGRNYV